MGLTLPERTFVALIVVWSLVLGLSPGLSIVGVAAAIYMGDRYQPGLIQRLQDQTAR